MSNIGWANCQTDQYFAKCLNPPGDQAAHLALVVNEPNVIRANERFAELTPTSLPPKDELCLTADDQFGFCLPRGFPATCNRQECSVFRPGERYDRINGRHLTEGEAHSKLLFTDRDVYPDPHCTGCETHYTQGPVLTDISGTQWWHLKRNNEDKIVRCSGTSTDASASRPDRPKPKLSRINSGFSDMDTRAISVNA